MDINKIVSNNIKKLREENSLSLEKLSVLTGVSKSMLGQIERCESSPSINVLWKIANGLKVSFDTLTNEDKDKIEKVKMKRPTIKDEGKFRLYPIFSFKHDRNFEMYRVEIDSQGAFDAVPHSKNSEEFITVYKGALSLDIDGKKIYVDKGESIRFNADKPHKYINDSLISTEFSLTIFYKK